MLGHPDRNLRASPWNAVGVESGRVVREVGTVKRAGQVGQEQRWNRIRVFIEAISTHVIRFPVLIPPD